MKKFMSITCLVLAAAGVLFVFAVWFKKSPADLISVALVVLFLLFVAYCLMNAEKSIKEYQQRHMEKNLKKLT